MKNKVLGLMLIALMCSACTTNNNNSNSNNSISKTSITSSSTNDLIGNNSLNSVDSTNKDSSSTDNKVSSSKNDNNIGSSSDKTSISSSTTNNNNNPAMGEKGPLSIATTNSTAPTNYYESVRGLKGAELKAGLHEIIKGHKTYAYNSTMNEYMKNDLDVDPDNSSNIILIYSGSKPKSTSFNKEHVWAKSHGDFGIAKGPGSDLHNLRPSIEKINSTRGNADFAEGGSEISGFPGNKNGNGTFEPSDEFKGDVARIIFYMATRYENAEGYPDLEVEASTNSRFNSFVSGAKGLHGDFDYLYKWATSGQDPVNNYEMKRNNKIYDDYQGNRNPFVDHPEFIQMIYDKNYNGPGALNDTGAGQQKPEDQAKDVENLINAIGNVTINSLEAIEKAEKAFEALSEDAKKLVKNYDTLLEARQEYTNLYNATIVGHVIELIDLIGEVTIEDKSTIEEAEKKYATLTNTQKDQVTNYNKLVSAREQLDDIISQIEATNKVLYTGEFGSSTGATNKYGSYTITMNSKSWKAEKAYKSGSDFRIGHNNANTIEAKFYNALGLTSSPDASSLEMQWDINNANGISFEYSTKYGTISEIVILKSTDGGNTYSVCLKEAFSEAKSTIEYKGEVDSNVRFALVITGSKPRLTLSQVTIRGVSI